MRNSSSTTPPAGAPGRPTPTGRRSSGPRRRRGLPAAAVAAACALTLGACGSGSGSATHSGGSGGAGSTAAGGSAQTASAVPGLYGSLPPVGSPKSGGTITIGILKGSTPTYAMPIIPSAQDTVYTVDDFIDLANQPLYWSPVGAKLALDPSLSLADAPTYTNGDKTVTIHIKPWKWSNGSTVTAQNVVEFIDILKAAIKVSTDNFGGYTPGFFPDNVASATASGQVLTLHLTKAFNPGFFTDNQLTLLYAYPPQWAVDKAGGPQLDYTKSANAVAIYKYLNKQASDVSTFGTNPLWRIADGPMYWNAFNATTGGYTMVPNPHYSGPQKVRYSALKAVVYTGTQAEMDSMLSGSLDMGTIDPSDIPSVGQLKGKYSVFGLPSFGFNAAFFNFADKTGDFNHIIGQLYVRQALAYLVNQPGYVRGILKGAGAVDYGPIPASPPSPYAPPSATHTPYPYNPSKAKALLVSHGWKVVPNGQTTCQDASKCAPNGEIPAGTKLAFNWDYASGTPSLQQESIAFASSAKALGINVALKEQSFNQAIQQEDDPASTSTINKWAVVNYGGYTNYLYPTTNSIFNTKGPYNQGFYSSKEADQLINASVYGSNPKAVANEANYLTENLPGLFEPNPDLIIAVKNGVSGTANSMLDQTQYVWTPQDWYFTK